MQADMRLPRPFPLIGPGSYTVLFSRAEPPAGRTLTTAHTLWPEQPSRGKFSANSMHLNSTNSYFRGRVKGLRYTDNMKREYYVYYTDRTKDTTTTWQILLNCTETVKKTRRCLLEQKDEVRDVQCIGEGWQRNKRKNRPYMKKGAEIKVLNGCQVASSSALNFLHGSRAHMWQRLIEVHGRNIKHRTHHLNTPPLQWRSVCYLWTVLEWPRKRNSCFRHVLAYMQIKLDESRSSGLSWNRVRYYIL